jgi:hypothetical protein
MKLEFSRQIFAKWWNKIKFHENHSSGGRVVPCGRTGMTKLLFAFGNSLNAPNISQPRAECQQEVPTNWNSIIRKRKAYDVIMRDRNISRLYREVPQTWLILDYVASAVTIATRLKNEVPKDRGRISGKAKKLVSSPMYLDCPWCPLRLLLRGYQALFPLGFGGGDVKLTTYPYSAELKNEGSYTPLYHRPSWHV